jgi:Putative peptidoglycan binding domain/HlyD family secretion protein
MSDTSTRLLRRLGIGATVVVLATATVGATTAVLSRPRAAEPAAEVRTGTAKVTRGNVAERQRFSGTLGFEDTYRVAHVGEPGVLTALAAAGTTVNRGGILYAVANRPARLLYGAIPAYRDLASGVTPGPDVRELEDNLVALGMDPAKQIVVDDRFAAATATAIRRWQASWGLPAAQRTGALPQGSVVFAPGALRIGQSATATGAMVEPGAAILSATSTNRVVLLELPAIRQATIHVGDQVDVTVDGVKGVARGKVSQVGRTATAQEDQQNGRPQGPPTIQVIVQVTLPAGSPDLDQSPVGVLLTVSTKQNVLLVPVVALLPKPGGGYRVRLAGGEYVDVTPGVYDEVAGTVEVTGNLTVGQSVQVPA